MGRQKRDTKCTQSTGQSARGDSRVGESWDPPSIWAPVERSGCRRQTQSHTLLRDPETKKGGSAPGLRRVDTERRNGKAGSRSGTTERRSHS